MLVLRTSKFQGATNRPIVPRLQHSPSAIVHSCVLEGHKFISLGLLRATLLYK